MAVAKILITAGEPAGIGPEIVVKLAQNKCSDQLIVCGNLKLLSDTAKRLNLPLSLTPYDPNNNTRHQVSHLWVIDKDIAQLPQAGILQVENAQHVVDTLETAAEMALKGQIDAILTGPVHKGIINESGISFSGHTEFFATKAGVKKVVMMLATEGLKVALATTHLPLSEVSKTITEDLLTEVISLLSHEMTKKFALKNPKIMILGLNPHAGEGGHLGREELDIIIPTLDKLNSRLGAELIGPIPADTAFKPDMIASVDVILAMYHDQGLPTLKHKGFGKAINLTLGLPFIRTSVDHGTGLDIAKDNIADIGSMQYALQFTQELIRNQ